MGTLQDDFLRKAAAAASASGHPFPEYAACEAALESAWGQSGLATRANNLFGQKQCQPPLDGTETLSLPTKEFLGGQWVTENANWAIFTDWNMCFHARMRLLQAASGKHPHYAAALAATTGEDFVREVSQTWSTDPARATKVLSIYAAHHACFASAQPTPTQPAAAQPATVQTAMADTPAQASTPGMSPGLG